MSKRSYPKLMILLVVLLALLLLVGSHSCSALEISQSITDEKEAYPLHILLATQGSAYRDAVVEAVIKAAENRQVDVLMINVSVLLKVNLDDWQGVVIVHAWES